MADAPPPSAPAELDSGALARGAVRWISLSSFLFALLAFFVMTPFVMELDNGQLIEGVLMTIVLSTAVLAVGTRPRTLVIAILLLIPALVARWARHCYGESIPAAAFLVPGLVFVLFVVLQLLRFILRAPRVDFQVLCAGLSGYLMLGLLWAFAYLITARTIPDSFLISNAPAGAQLEGFTALYLSMVTLSTVGYGDILPVSNVARMLAMMEATLGTFYVTVLLARLVSMHTSVAPPAARGDSAVSP